MEHLRLSELRVLDAGSGLSNRLLDWYRPRVRHAYLLDFLAPPSERGNTTIVQADLEKEIPLADASVDLVTSASSIEHLSANGQSRFMSEAQRLLRPGGILVMTVSYILGLNDRALVLLANDPALVRTGCTISARLDLRRLLEAAPMLRCPVEPQWERFPGFKGFSEASVSANFDIILDRVGSYGDVRCLPETDALGLQWAEIAMYLVKQ
jgi:SAM-dependent methyltransferase